MKALLPTIPMWIVAAVIAVTAPSATTPRHDLYPLRVGSAGPNCATVKFLIRDPRPKANVFTKIKGTYAKKDGMGGFCNKAWGKAVVAYKWRLGYPKTWVKPIAGRYFIALLRGQKERPLSWALVASSRLRAIEASTPTKFAVRWKAQLVAWLGIHETGNNSGPCISTSCTWRGVVYPAIQAATHAFYAAWCVSTQQAVAKLIGYGTFAGGTAGVYAAVDYYHARHRLFAPAKVGSIVAFLTLDRYGNRIPGTGHMGFVTKVTSKGFSYIAGNDGNAVREHYILFGSRPYIFIRLKGVA